MVALWLESDAWWTHLARCNSQTMRLESTVEHRSGREFQLSLKLPSKPRNTWKLPFVAHFEILTKGTRYLIWVVVYIYLSFCTFDEKLPAAPNWISWFHFIYFFLTCSTKGITLLFMRMHYEWDYSCRNATNPHLWLFPIVINSPWQVLKCRLSGNALPQPSLPPSAPRFGDWLERSWILIPAGLSLGFPNMEQISDCCINIANVVFPHPPPTALLSENKGES